MTTTIRRLIFTALITVAFVSVGMWPGSASAQPSTVKEGIKILQDTVAKEGQGLATEEGGTIIARVINLILGLAAVLTLIALIIGGVMYILSFGSEERAKKAKNIIIYAIVGLIVIMLSFFLLFLVRAILAPPPAP